MRHTIRSGVRACWRVLVPLGIAVSATLVACGGGGGTASTGTTTTTTPATPSSTVSGTAASGAPIANVTVTLKDSTNKSVTATTSVSGAFTLDSSSLTPPFLLQVTTPGGTKLLSASSDANETTTINITPLTDVVVRSWFSLQGKSADAAFSDPVTLPPPTPAQVTSVAQLLLNDLKLAITASGAPITAPLDLIAKAFTADHTGIDKLLDNTRVTLRTTGVDLVLVAGTATQTTKLDFDTAASAITATTSTTSGTATTTATSTDVVPVQSAQASAIDAMKATLASAVNTVRTKGSALAVADLEPYFAADLMHQGQDRTTFLQNGVAQIRQMQSVNFELVQVRSLDLAAGKALVQVRFSGTVNGLADENREVVFFARGSDGTWRFAGDGRIAEMSVQAEGRSGQGIMLPGPNPTSGGNGPAVNVDVRPPLGLVSSATVSSSFAIPPFSRGSTDASESPQRDVFYTNTGPISGTLPAAGTPVTITLAKSAGGTVTYTLPLNAFTTELIAITQPTPTTTITRTGAVTVSWTLPRTYAVQTIKVNVQTFTGDQTQANGFQCSDDGAKVATTATTASVTIPATCNGLPVKQANISVATEGFNGERSMVIHGFNVTP